MNSLGIIAAAKKRPAITAATAFIALILVVLYFRYDQVGIHETVLSESQGNLAKLQRNVVNSAQLDRQLAEIIKVNELVESEVLRPSELARNLQFFYKLEADNNVKLLDLQQQAIASPARGTSPSMYSSLNFSVNISGDYDHLLKFMREVEKTFIGGKVLSATISPGSAVAGQDPSKARLLSMTVQTVATNK